MTIINIIKGNEKLTLEHCTSGSLLDTLRKHNVLLESPCGGNGTCGKCKIQVIEGDVPSNENNSKTLSKREIEDGYRLACKTYISKPITFKINVNEDKYDIETKYINKDIKIDTRVKKHTVKIDNKLLGKAKSVSHYINSVLSQELTYSFKALKKLSKFLNDGFENNTLYIIEKDNYVYDVTERDYKLYGIAVDIGTTTIAIALIDMMTAKVIDTFALLNLQKKFGHDVISRINYSSQSQDNLNNITSLITEDIKKSIIQLMSKNDIEYKQICDVCISANTTMVQLLLGLQSHPIAVAPFTMVTDSILEYDFKEIFDESKFDCKTVIVPCVSAYVGGDIVSGIINTKLYQDNDLSLLIDIGTNGEMVLGNKDKILCAATAAGPAFEGATIYHGIGSIKGAINHITIKNNKVSYDTIGDKEPVGICGSGIIDIVAEFIKNNIIKQTGQYNKEYTNSEGNYNITNDIVFTQKDIREIQLAKSAIRSGIEVLIKEFGCSYKDIKNVYIAGGFGNKIRIDSASEIGLIPAQLKDKVIFIGNSSLSGSIDVILNKSLISDLKYIIDKTEYIELSTNTEFNRLFIEHMTFN